MSKGTAVTIIILVILVIAGFWVFGNNPESEPAEGKGRLYVSVTDAAADMSTINEVELEIESIEVLSETKGWTEVSSDSETYSLLELNADGSVVLHDTADLDPETFTKVRVMVGDVTVDSETEGEVEAVLPSGMITFDADVVVEEGEDSVLKLDFKADQSLHITGNGEFIFAPVVEAKTTSGAEVDIESGNKVKVTGGNMDTRTNIGVDLDGQTKVNFRLENTQGLELEVRSGEGVVFMLNDKMFVKSEAGNATSSEARGGSMMRGEAEASGNAEANVGSEAGANAEVDARGEVEAGGVLE